MSGDPSPGPGERGEGVSPRDGDDWDQDAVLDELMAAFDSELGQKAAADRSDQVPECMDAGFLPRGRASGPAITNLARGGCGTGFASGAELDTALPGPALAGFADAAAGSDRAYTDLDDDELIGALTAWQKTEAWAASGKLSAVAELIRRRPGGAGTSDGPAGAPVGWGKFCSDELAVALASSQRAAERMLGVAYDLAFRPPRTAQALSEGLTDSYKALIIAEATRVLDDAGAAAAESLVLADVAGKTPGQIRAMIGRAILRVDPDAARQRREQAQRDARVELWREDVGTAALCGFGLPPDEALAADQMISSRALELKAAGMAGTMDQLRVRAYLDVLLGQDSSPVLAGQDSSARQSTGGAVPAGTEGQGHPSVTTIVVEHRDRCARFGAEYVEAALAASGRRLLVVDPAGADDDLVRDVTEILTFLGARRSEGSPCWHEAKRKLAKVHARVANIRSNAIHQATTRLAKTHGVLVIEDLAVAPLARGLRRHRKAWTDAAAGEMRRQLTYKADWCGCDLWLAGRWYPSSKTCSACGQVNTSLTLADRTWCCPLCGTLHDRDENAGTNLARLPASQAEAPSDGKTGPAQRVAVKRVNHLGKVGA